MKTVGDVFQKENDSVFVKLVQGLIEDIEKKGFDVWQKEWLREYNKRGDNLFKIEEKRVIERGRFKRIVPAGIYYSYSKEELVEKEKSESFLDEEIKRRDIFG